MKPLNEEKKAEEVHLHGGSPLRAFEKYGIPAAKVTDFSVNVSPLGPPRAIFKSWDKLSGLISSYPSVNGDGVADYYIQRFGLKRENVLPGNGSSECIYLVPRVLKLKKVCIVTPSFHDYERSCLLSGAEIVPFALKESNRFAEPDWQELESNLQSVDALFLGNPNNPTGTLFDANRLLELADRFPDKWILVDEAFIQFLKDYKSKSLIHPGRLRRNLIIFHSLTKLYDLPGIRLGCAISHEDTIQRFMMHKEPWTVNGLAEKIAQLLVDCGDYEKQLQTLVIKENHRIGNALNDQSGFQLYPSGINFFLAQWTASERLDDLIQFLLKNGIHVRDCRNFRGLEKNYFRFAVLKSPENTLLIDLLIRSLKDFQS